MDNEPLTIELETEKLRSYDMQTDSSMKHLSEYYQKIESHLNTRDIQKNQRIPRNQKQNDCIPW